MSPTFRVLAALLLLANPEILPAGDVRPGGELEAVAAADDARILAMTEPNRDELDRIFSDELRYSHSNGNVDTKASFIDALTSGKMTYAAVDYEERSFSLPAPTIALMTGRAGFRLGSVDAPAMRLGFLAVWRLEDGQWRFLAWQSYKVPADNPK